MINLAASVITNDIISKSFTLTRGTRQGCPLSPLLFVLAIEPLVIAIRSNQNIVGIKINETDNKIGLFADDIVIFLSQLQKSLNHLFCTVGSFSKLFGYKVNESKSAILIFSHFQIVKDHFNYLGIRITSKIDDLVELNYNPVMETS